MECGNSVIDSGEQCDDGNRNDADGCSSTCSIENSPPDCSGGYAEVDSLWPPNHKFAKFIIKGITDPDNDNVVISLLEISQNEPTTQSKGDQFCPDALLVPSSIRIERSGQSPTKQGRTYSISFEADDGKGAKCSGVARVCIPHDQHHDCYSVLTEPFYDSTIC